MNVYGNFLMGVVCDINIFCCCFIVFVKLKKLIVLGIVIDKVNVIYNFDIGGGYIYEFRVMYRKKCEFF